MTSVAQNKAKRMPLVVEDVALAHRCNTCGAEKPRTGEYFHYNNRVEKILKNICKACQSERDNARDRARSAEYRTEMPRDKAIVPTRTEVVTVYGRDFTVGWHAGATYWPVKPFVEAAGLDWAGQEKRIKSDARLAATIEKLSMVAADGKQREMLCLPWSLWHYFWTGTHSPKAERWREEAAEALALVFGDTAGKVLQDKPVAQRVADTRVNARPSLSPSEMMRQRPELFMQWAEAARAAEERAADRERAKAETATALAKAREHRTEAAQLLAMANAEESRALAADAVAEAALIEARCQLNALLVQIDALADEDTQYVYLFGAPDMLSRMFADGKVGDTRNKMQRRKQLRAGDLRKDYITAIPCENGEECASVMLEFLCANGAQKKGNDHFENAPGHAINRLVSILRNSEYLTPDALRALLYDTP